MKRAFRSAPDGHRSDVDTRHPRYEETCPVLDANRRPCPYQRSIDVTRFGDTTPRIIRETGARSHTELGDRGPAVRDYEEGNEGGSWRRLLDLIQNHKPAFAHSFDHALC